jgi:hypothetical protein
MRPLGLRWAADRRVDGIDLPLSLRSPKLPLARLDARGRPWWWYPNVAGLARIVEAGGFQVIDGPHRLFVPRGKDGPSAGAIFDCFATARAVPRSLSRGWEIRTRCWLPAHASNWRSEEILHPAIIG